MAEQSSDQPLDQTLSLAGKGDAQAWRRIVELYSGRIYGLLVRQCGDRELAEEITQSTFVKVVTQIDRYHEQGKFEPWLFRIAMNRLRDEMRRRKRQARPMDMTGTGAKEGGPGDGGWSYAQDQIVGAGTSGGGMESDNPAERAEVSEQIDRLRAAIGKLSGADQEILNMRHTAGLSFGEIAQSLGEPLGTVLARGHRALAKLRKLMESQDDE